MKVNWQALLWGELSMTLNILVGFLIGDLVLRFEVAEKLLKRLLPILRRVGVGPVLGLALTVSVGSSKAGAALLASALEEEKITRNGALWGTISLSFPAYLRRWPSTLFLALGMAGRAGGIFASILLLYSLGRFLLALWKSRNSEREAVSKRSVDSKKERGARLYKRLIRTLPLAWLFFAMAFVLIPYLETLFREHLGGSFLPLAAWGVASSAVASVGASLAMAGGGLAAGDLSVAQAVFALLLGHGLSYFTRALRHNAGYFFGLFPGGMAKSILIWNIVSMLPFVLLALLIAALPLMY